MTFGRGRGGLRDVVSSVFFYLFGLRSVSVGVEGGLLLLRRNDSLKCPHRPI